MIKAQLMAPTIIAMFILLLVLVVPSGGWVLQSTLAQVDVDADTLIQETRDEVEQEIGQEVEQEAEQDQEQNQENNQNAEQSNKATASQNEENNQVNVGAGDGNVITNVNEFGDDDTIVDEDNLADQDAANVGVQEQDATQDIDQVQDATNFNFDFDFQYGFQADPP
jgi:hypothetical protein